MENVVPLSSTKVIGPVPAPQDIVADVAVESIPVAAAP